MGRVRPLVEATLTVGQIATGLSASSLRDLVEAEILIETGAVRMRVDGGDPTGAAGPLRERGYSKRLTGHEAVQARFIRADSESEDARVQVTSYGWA